MKFRKSLSIIRKIALSLIIILIIFITSNYPVGNSLIQRIIPPSVNEPRRKWEQRRRVRVYTTHLLCGHQDLVVNSHRNRQFLKEVITRYNQHKEYKIQLQGRIRIYRIPKRDRCLSCDSHLFLGINGENVVVRYGTPAKPGPVRETLHINVNKLPNSERDDLVRGIRFTDNKEKLQIIEGLSELISAD